MVVFDENMQPEGLLLGTEASSIIRKTDDRVLIVGCTGNSIDDDIKKSKDSGQDVFWSKPAPPSKEALESLVGALVKRRQVQKKASSKESQDREGALPIEIGVERERGRWEQE